MLPAILLPCALVLPTALDTKSSLIELGWATKLRLNPPRPAPVQRRLVDVRETDGVALHEIGFACTLAVRPAPARVVDLPIVPSPKPIETTVVEVTTDAPTELRKARRMGAHAVRPAFPDLAHETRDVLAPPFDDIAERKPPVRRKQILGRRRSR